MDSHLHGIWKKTWHFFARLISKEFLVFLFFLAVSGFFWLLQTLDETFEVGVTVPLQLANVPEDVVIATELPSQVTAKVRDKGAVLLPYRRKGAIKPVVLDFRQYDKGLACGRAIVSVNSVIQMIQRQLESTSRVQSLTTDTLMFYYNRGVFARLPIKVTGTITSSPQTYLTEVSCVPDSVLVYAPDFVLDTMRAAYTQPVDMLELRKTTTRSAGFRPMLGVKYEPSDVKVTAKVDFFTDKTITVPIVGLNFPANMQLRTFPSSVQITYRVGATHYNDFNPESFVLAPTYEELLNNVPEKYHLRLRSVPDGVSNVRINPSEVDYLIEKVEKEEEEE